MANNNSKYLKQNFQNHKQEHNFSLTVYHENIFLLLLVIYFMG